MNILIVTDNYSQGGLEKHIETLYEELKNKNNFYFAFGNCSDSLERNFVFKDFNFKWNATVEEFCTDVNRLVSLIKKFKIDVINVHPFYSVFPVFFAAHLTNTKVVYTYHGVSSFSFPSMLNDGVLFEYAIESLFTSIICVNEFGVNSFIGMNYKNAFLLPNPIDCKKYKITKIQKNKSWALISRLDNDKKSEIIRFLELLPQLDIEKVDIYGNGTEFEIIKKYIVDNKLNVELKGYINNVNERLLDNYTGIIGLGRVAMEGLCMNYPVLLIGYGKIFGMINRSNIDYLKKYNFVNSELGEVELEYLKKDIKNINDGKYSKFLFSSKMTKFCDATCVSQKYIEILKKENFGKSTKIVELYSKIEDLSKSELGKESFYNCVPISELLIAYIGNLTRNIHVKNSLLQLNNVISLKKDIWTLNDRLLLLEEKVNRE